LWFTNTGNNSIGRISTSGVVTNDTGTGIDAPYGITAGPDGALWFTNTGNNSIGRISTSGVVTNDTGTGIDAPYGITAGPDGALWFTNQGHNSIGRVTTGGPEVPLITSPNSATATAGTVFSFTVTTSGTPIPSIKKSGKLPKLLAFANNHDGTALIAGVPVKSGVYHLKITATFGRGKTKKVAAQAFTLTVNPD
jgi:hypothetical protein